MSQSLPNAFYNACVRAAHHAPGEAEDTVPFEPRFWGARAWRSPYTFLTAPRLFGIGTQGAWEEALSPSATPPGLLRFELLPADAPSFAPFAAACAALGLATAPVRRFDRPMLDATMTPDAWRALLSRQRRKALRKARAGLEAEGTLAVHRHTSEAGIAGAFLDFLALERAGWKGRRGTALDQIPEHRLAFGAALNGLAARRACEIHTLTLDDKPLAAGVVLLDPPHAFYVKIAYDEDYARFSPGVLLSEALTESYLAHPRITLLDSCASEGNAMIEWLWPQRRPIVDMVVASRPGIPATAVEAGALAFRTHHAAREAAKTVLPKTVLTRLRA
ncbi:MAG: GNAT family N-acetyltransferase [Pseudomonadota bacterium]